MGLIAGGNGRVTVFHIGYQPKKGTEIIEPFPQITAGQMVLPDRPGLGWEPNIEKILKYRV